MALWRRLADLFGAGGGDRAAREAAERILLEADFGVGATQEILDRLERNGARDRTALERIVVELLGAASPPGAATLARAARPPTVVLVFGVNGAGKTTTVAKLARRLEAEGRSVLLSGADTFRAGAVEQLRIWADRLGVPFVGARSAGRGEGGGGGGGGGVDPAAVAFDAVDAAAARGIDTVLVDTAGRLHTDERLLEELKKVVRVVAKRQPGAPHEALLVVDATVGQNVVAQGQRFAGAVPLTGVIVTKLDGTAKGGSVVALRRAVPVPIRFLGTGEEVDDLEPFDPARYARRLIGA